VSSSFAVEGALRCPHLLQLRRRELHAHRRQLFHAHAVAGHRAAQRDAFLQDLGAEELGAMQLVGVVGVEQDERRRLPSPAWKTLAQRSP
jgi:hypothetical protein